jgi:phasin family protein
MFPQLFPLQQAISPTLTAHIDNIVTLYTAIARSALESMQKLSEVQMQLARELIADFGAGQQRLMASKDAAGLGSAVANQLRPGADALRNYQQRLSEAIGSANAGMAQAAANHMPAVRQSATAVAQEMMRNATEETARVMAHQQQNFEQMGVQNAFSAKPAGQVHH